MPQQEPEHGQKLQYRRFHKNRNNLKINTLCQEPVSIIDYTWTGSRIKQHTPKVATKSPSNFAFFMNSTVQYFLSQSVSNTKLIEKPIFQASDWSVVKNSDFSLVNLGNSFTFGPTFTYMPSLVTVYVLGSG